MKLRVIVHEAEEGGYWAEVPSIPGCATQGESFEDLLQNLYEAVEACLSVPAEPTTTAERRSMVTEENVMEALKTVNDPELMLPLVDLGLIYGVEVQGDDVAVTMTLTTPACPMNQY